MKRKGTSEMPQKQNPETVIQNQIRDLLRMDGWFVIRHQQGMGCHKGLSDLTAIKDGITIYIEVKTKTGKQSDWQRQFQKDVENHGGTYILARRIEDVEPYLTSIKKLF